MPLRRRNISGGSSGSSVETLNILNGVLNCAWDKTSYSPKLLEIYENSQVKFNIDSNNPLVLAFANGWDDLDRPAQVVKRLAVAPSNIDLSGKASCTVQIVAKVVNDELVITTHDIYDPVVGYGSNVIPTFANANPVNGWSCSANNKSTDAWKTVSNQDLYWRPDWYGWFNVYYTAPYALAVSAVYTKYNRSSTKRLFAKDLVSEQWVQIGADNTTANGYTWAITNPSLFKEFREELMVSSDDLNYAKLQYFRIYESPTAKFFRSLNKVKDRSDVEQLWINLGYATVDASGNITALTHYTDLRNNYPGGMRVES